MFTSTLCSADQFKKKLEIYTQRKSLDLPVYNTERDGLCFTSRVSIGENWFRSEELCKTVDEAENAAAQAALLSLSTDALHENDKSSYKNLLQELTQSEGFLLPTYTTTESNDPHCRTFSSTVEVEGEVFQGAAAKSKKLAELNAAKTAYTIFVERKLFQPGYVPPRASSDDVLKLTPCLGSLTISDHQENPKPEMKTYLLCNRFKVFTCIPNTPLPEGVVVLPISDNKWTMVSLEFRREKGV
ncbi:hypothetical protein BUALT_Bualt13G0049900 [Buddleja alternifolia]|uniref:DRBM domain-containing protein n=1 Tax=Buddleja alternifolia TaxID=168488 RepID=A0AAV6WRK0_9LAMI|nr:hypothetical protein BUALT_Bualt13G0049900 [Buddleja alternifolia]